MFFLRLRSAHSLKLRDIDRQRRFHMCQWLETLSDDELKNIAFSDEATFCLGKKKLDSRTKFE